MESEGFGVVSLEDAEGEHVAEGIEVDQVAEDDLNPGFAIGVGDSIFDERERFGIVVDAGSFRTLT